MCCYNFQQTAIECVVDGICMKSSSLSLPYPAYSMYALTFISFIRHIRDHHLFVHAVHSYHVRSVLPFLSYMNPLLSFYIYAHLSNNISFSAYYGPIPIHSFIFCTTGATFKCPLMYLFYLFAPHHISILAFAFFAAWNLLSCNAFVVQDSNPNKTTSMIVL